MDADNTLTISTKLGSLQGSRRDNVASFLGVPYAKNPFIDEHRFQAPEPFEQWDGVLNARQSGQAVPQPGRGKEVELVGAPGDLTLNIWATYNALVSDRKLPVLVWIPGGAFIRGDASEQVYDGSCFAQKDIIVVSINYRVGVDGFMHLPGAPDNRGILDQIMALQWVQANIADFGGDPNRVTLAGQSAGAESVAILMGASQAKGLFHQAIMQSPSMQCLSQAQAARIAQCTARRLNVAPTVNGLSSLPYPELVSAVIDMGIDLQDRDEWGMLSWGGTAFLPVVDDELIKDTPMQALSAKADPTIPVIVGSTDQEARLYLVPGGAIDDVSETDREQFLADLSLSGDPLQTYSQAATVESVGDTFADIQSDYTFRMSALHIAEHLLDKGSKVWHYHFTWPSPAYNGRLGAAHFVDVPFSFNTIDSEEAGQFVGEHPPQELAQAMHGEWADFIKGGTVG